MNPAPEINLVHTLPGRVRLHCRRLKGNPDLMAEVIGNLQALPVVTRVEGNPVTGNVLLLFEPHKVLSKPNLRQLWGVLKMVSPSLTPAQVAKFVKPGAQPVCAPVPLAGSIAQFFGTVNTAVGNAMGGVDLKMLVPATLFILGIRGLFTEKATLPAWYNLLWFALSTFVMFHPTGAHGLAEAQALNATMEGMAELAGGD